MSQQVVENLSIIKFNYKGTHSHPVRRTIVLIEDKPNYYRGYELREGKIARLLKEAPIKSYTKAKIPPSDLLQMCLKDCISI